MDKFINVSEAAKIYKISKYALYKAIQKTELKNNSANGKMYLLDQSEIEKWLKTAKIRRPTEYKISYFYKDKEITKDELVELVKRVKW